MSLGFRSKRGRRYHTRVTRAETSRHGDVQPGHLIEVANEWGVSGEYPFQSAVFIFVDGHLDAQRA